MSTIYEKATVDFYLNGEMAEKEMARLTEQLDKLKKAKDAALSAGNTSGAKKLDKEIVAVERQLNRVNNRVTAAGAALNDLSNTHIHGLRNALKHLNRQLAATNPNTAEWRRYAAQINVTLSKLAIAPRSPTNLEPVSQICSL